MFSVTPLLWLLIVGSAWGYPHLPNHAPQISSTQPIPPDVLITLERTGCEGGCAVYSLSVFADGRVVYRGKYFVRNRGRAEAKLTLEQLRQLLAEFEKADYFSLRNRYQYPQEGCPSTGIDYPGAITSFRINGRAKTITHDYGCREKSPDGAYPSVYPRELFALERRIDEIVGTSKWTK